MADETLTNATRLQQSLLIACLARGHSQFAGVHVDEPTRRLIDGLLALGASLIVDKPTARIDIAGTGGHWPNIDAELSCGGSMPLACLLIAACTVGRGQYSVDCAGGEQAVEALTPLLDALRDIGANIGAEPDHLGSAITVAAATLHGGSLTLKENTPPCVVHAIMLTAPYATRDVFISGPGQDRTSFADTVELMGAFGVSVVHEGDKLIIPAPQIYLGREVDAGYDL